MRKISSKIVLLIMTVLIHPFIARGNVCDLLSSTNHKILFFDEKSYITEPNDTVNSGVIDIDRLADSLTNKVLGENRIVDMLDPSKVYTLPLGIVKEVGGIFYTIVLDNLKFTPSGAVMKAYMSLSFPGSTKKIGLVADSVKVGINGIEAAKLKILRDKTIPLMGNELLVDSDSTYIEWDCNGYKGAQLSAKILLNPKRFFKENPKNRARVLSKVEGKIFCTITDFNDILLTVTLDPFQINGLQGYSFYPKEIVLDLSDTRNYDQMVFPNDYQSELFDSDNKKPWRGLYISSFTLKFPKTFAKNSPAPEINASRFLIDIEGITGSLSYNSPIIGIDKGNLGGWKFSINSMSLSLVKSEISGFGMGGGIILPITEPNKPLTYNASIDADNNFLFTVSIPENINAPLFGSGSKITLTTNSKITVAAKDGEYYPKAELHGQLKVNVGSSPSVNLSDISFQGLLVQTIEPKISVQSFSMTSGSMAGFPVQINRICTERNLKDTLLGLRFDASANLMESKITGSTSFILWADNKSGSWKHKNTELRKIEIDANTGVITLKGALVNFKEDKVYGDGYLGFLEMGITPGIEVQATAQFGNISGFRYWYADAGLALPTGLTLFPGIAIYGFGGGAYYRMERTLPANIHMEKDTSNTPLPPKLGVSRSGIVYKPSKRIDLGVMAKVIIGTQPSSSAFNGSVTFGIEFNSAGGVNLISFRGDGRFMTEINKNVTDSKVKATVDIQYLFAKKELSGFAEAYVNVANVITGGGPKYLAGRVDFFFGQDQWFIYIGTPSLPVDLKMMKTLNVRGYFMVGTVLPDFPALPPKLANLSGLINFSNLRNENLTKTGGGFAFGASITANTGEQKFLIFYGKFDFGAGFDFMLQNYGSDARCEGFTEPLGINGWYAQGQAWAWVDAEISVRVKVLKNERKFTIMDAGFAAVLGAQLPNPTYLAGAAQAHFSVLGGLVKGKCYFEFSYGDQCKLLNTSAVEGVNVIAELTPAEGKSNVDVFITPQVAFNMPIDQEFEILDNDGTKKEFRATLDFFKLSQNGQEISCSKEWNGNKSVLALRPSEILPGQTPLKVEVKIHFQIKSKDGHWKDYSVGGKVENEERIVLFTTGDAPDYVTENNVKTTYPIRNMVNLYKNEHGKLFVQVYQGISYLFNKSGDWRYEAHFKTANSNSVMPITYNNSTNRIEFDVPDNLQNNSIYTLNLVRVANTDQTYQSDINVVNKENDIDEIQTVTTKDIEGELSDEGITKLYTLLFRTSQFNTFLEKVTALSVTYSVYSVTDHYKQLHLNFKGKAPLYELFDNWEIQNIKICALVDQTYWYVSNYKNLLYQSYPLAEGMEITNRDPYLIGVPPVWVSNLAQYSEIPTLTEDAITQGRIDFNNQSLTRVEYNLNYYLLEDWNHLRNKTFDIDPGNRNPVLVNIKNSSFYGLYSSSEYPIKLMYFIPGETEPSTEYFTKIHF